MVPLPLVGQLEITRGYVAVRGSPDFAQALKYLGSAFGIAGTQQALGPGPRAAHLQMVLGFDAEGGVGVAC